MRIETNNAYASTLYHGLSVDKNLPQFALQDSRFQDSLNDETKEIKNVYHDIGEFNPLNFIGASYMRSKILDKPQNMENSISLTPETSFSIGTYCGQDVMLNVGDNDVSASWGSSPLGDGYVKNFNDTLRGMLNGVVDANGIPDISKLTKDQQSVLNKMSKSHQSMITQLGGVQQYTNILNITQSFDSLIRVSNGQMPISALNPDVHHNIKEGLERVGIDTSKPFYINEKKFTFSEGGALQLA